ncbi:MAG: biosynthetic arginine decarboxylase [Planctomycetes bacterium]|nr:biosynthetic arginine decarboxylase [Planctomycetota bacterium]
MKDQNPSTVQDIVPAQGPAPLADDSPAPADSNWTVADAADLYQLNGWGKGFFGINQAGHVVVMPTRDPKAKVDLHEVVTGLEERGIGSPVILGFTDLLAQRVHDMHGAFLKAIKDCEYKGEYRAVYPIKVNQQHYLVQKIRDCGREYNFGLEAGSKPELLAVMGMTVDEPERLIICNGFKEERYIRHIMLAAKLGRRIVTVIENMSELELIIQQSESYGVRAGIGVRVNLSMRGSGRWHKSSGEKAKFGLSIPSVLKVVERLREANRLDCLQLIHCHMGSQLSDIAVVNAGVNELTRVYVELAKLGAGLKYIDVGGGLGVDYDGSQTNWDFSTNYTLDEYASNVVYRVQSVCDEAEVPHPTIVTEAGRAMVSHHSVLVFNVLGSNRLDQHAVPEDFNVKSLGKRPPRVLRDLADAFDRLGPANLLECFHDAQQAREEALTLFNVGNLSLENRGLVDRLFWSTCLKVRDLASLLDPVPEELIELEQKLSDTYFVNLSIFQSLPDSWAIDQIFPILPIHRLTEQPRRKATLADITCDSDGKIDRFVDVRDVRNTLPLHEIKDGEPYYLAAFLVGAYQETLGDLHNLFGDTNVVHIRLDESGDWNIDEIVEGDTVREVLTYLQYDPRDLYQAIRRDCERCVRTNQMSVAESRILLGAYEQGLSGYTYLE